MQGQPLITVPTLPSKEPFLLLTVDGKTRFLSLEMLDGCVFEINGVKKVVWVVSLSVR